MNPADSNVVFLNKEIEQIVREIGGLVQIRVAAQPADPTKGFTFRKLPEEALRSVELAADEVCEACGRSGTTACTICPLDSLFARIG
jgi:hypothetical protein